MRILSLASYFYPHIGGSQRYAEELYANLVALNPDIKVDVVCYNTKKVKAKEVYQGLDIYRVPCREILPGQFALPDYFSLFRTIRQLTKKNHYDFVNSQNRFFDHSWWTPVLAKKIKAKSILTDHCASHPEHQSFLIRSIAKIIDQLFVPIVARAYDYIIATNKTTAQFIKTLGVKNPLIVYGGVDISLFHPSQKKEVRTVPNLKQKFNTNDLIITFLGRMIPSKGPQLLFKSAKILNQRFNNLYFIFAGEGAVKDKLSLCLLPNTFFTGPLTKQQTAKLLAQSDIVVHPSLHHEGFPNVILEAGASGCAVIATNQGGTAEIIDNGKNGLLVKPDVSSLTSAIEDLVHNKGKRLLFGQELRKKIAKNFNWKKIAKSYQELLFRLKTTKF